ncbi:MAG: SLC13 family permease [Pseudomonadales bacterium]
MGQPTGQVPMSDAPSSRGDSPTDDASSSPSRAARIGLPGGPLLAVVSVLATHPAALGWGGLPAEAALTLGVLALMAIWWVTLAVEPAVTGLVPFVAFAALGIGTPAQISAPYANPVIFLFAGGALIGLALERSGVSARFASMMVSIAGSSPLRVLSALIIATALLSAFVSNLATAATMLPLAMALGTRAALDAQSDQERAAANRFMTSLLLGVAFASSAGGTLTIIGTAPNAIAVEWLRNNGHPVDFLAWLTFSVPTLAVFLPILIAVLGVWLFPAREISISRFENASKPLGRDGYLVLAVFFAAVAAWVTRPLYASYLPMVTDGSIAVAAAIALFLAPSDAGNAQRVLAPSAFANVPWRVLLLFGGGLCLADAMQRTGLSAALGDVFAGAGVLPTVVLLAMLAAVIVFASEVASNTALAAMVIPIVGAFAPGLGVEPAMLVIPAAFAASLAFALPVGTPPNALVFGTGRLRAEDMMRAGVVLDLIAIAVIVTMASLLL